MSRGSAELGRASRVFRNASRWLCLQTHNQEGGGRAACGRLTESAKKPLGSSGGGSERSAKIRRVPATMLFAEDVRV